VSHHTLIETDEASDRKRDDGRRGSPYVRCPQGWEKRIRKTGLIWSSADLNAAAALCAAQFPAAALLWWVGSFSRDDYGAGTGGALAVV
jgi:hypothetical protein